MKRPYFLHVVVLAILLAACGGNKTSNEATPAQTIDFIVLQMNDVYEIGPLEGGKVAGMARVATLRDQLLAENPNVITILSGDFVSPSLIGTLRRGGAKIAGAQMVDVMNVAGVDYVTFGNHEFDIKESELLARLNESEFVWTCSNVQHKLDSVTHEPFSQNGTPVPEFVVHDITSDAGSLKLGLVGVVLPFNPAEYVHYEDVTESFKAAQADAVAAGANAVIGITHLEMEDDKKLGEAVENVPLFLGGHDHTNMTATAGGTTITKADANAKTVYVHRCSYDPATGKITVESELTPVDESLAFQPATDKVVQQWLALADSAMRSMGYDPDEVLMTTEMPLDGRETSMRYGPTNLGELICNAMLAAAPDQQIALLNSGSVRVDDQLSGDITQTDVLRTLPFGGELAIATISGELLVRTLEVGTVTNVGLGGYLQVAGVSKEGDTWMHNGAAIDPAGSYKVVGSDYFMKGLDANFEFLQTDMTPEYPEELANGMRNDVRDAVIGYMKTQQASPN